MLALTLLEKCPINQALLSVGVPAVNMLYQGKHLQTVVKECSLFSGSITGQALLFDWAFLAVFSLLYIFNPSSSQASLNPLPVIRLSFLSVVNPFLFLPHPPLSCSSLPPGRMTATPRSPRCSGRGTVFVTLCFPICLRSLTWCHLVSTSSRCLAWPLLHLLFPPLGGWGCCGARLNHMRLSLPASHLCDVVFPRCCPHTRPEWTLPLSYRL